MTNDTVRLLEVALDTVRDTPVSGRTAGILNMLAQVIVLVVRSGPGDWSGMVRDLALIMASDKSGPAEKP